MFFKPFIYNIFCDKYQNVLFCVCFKKKDGIKEKLTRLVCDSTVNPNPNFFFLKFGITNF